MCTKLFDHMMYGSWDWDMVHDRCNCNLSFWAIFCPFTPLTAQKIKILTKWKNAWRIIILHTCTKNYDQMICDSLDMAHNRRTDGQTDGKSDILRWVLHLKIITVPFMPCWECNKEKYITVPTFMLGENRFSEKWYLGRNE